MGQEETTQVSHVCTHAIQLIASLNTVDISLYIPRNYQAFDRIMYRLIGLVGNRTKIREIKNIRGCWHALDR